MEIVKADVGGLIALIVWALIALVGFFLKQRQAANQDDWDDNWEEEKPPPTPQPQPQPQPRQRPQQEWAPRQQGQQQTTTSTSRDQQQPLPQPRRHEETAPAQRRQPPPRQPAGDAQSARSVIEAAIRRQQQLAEQKAKPAKPLAPAMPAVPATPSLSSLPPLPSAGAPSALTPMPGPAVSRKRAFVKLDLRSRAAWRQAIIMREVLERPRAYDT